MIWLILVVAAFIGLSVIVLAKKQSGVINSQMRLMVQRQGAKLVEHVPRGSVFSSRDAHSRTFLQTTLTMLACLTRADGKVTPREVEFVNKYLTEELELQPEVRDRAIHMLRNARIGAVTFERAARTMKKKFGKNPELLLTQIYILIRLAHVDDEFALGERMLIDQALHIFDIGPVTVQFPYSSGFATLTFDPRYATPMGGKQAARIELHGSKGPYEILGCKKGASPKEIRAAYHERAKRYHPDRLLSKGLPKEFLKLAEERFQEIQKAYEDIRGSG